MKLLNQVKDELEKEKGYDFSSEIWTGEMLSMMYDIVQATESKIKLQQRELLSKYNNYLCYMNDFDSNKTDDVDDFLKSKHFNTNW